MRKLRLLTLMMLALATIFGLVAISLPERAIAQDNDVGTPPAVLTPGARLGFRDPVGDATLSFNDCFTPFDFLRGDEIFIEPGVNIRSAPDFSSPIVWNTSNQQVDEDGDRLDPEEEFNVSAFVLEGPVCSNSFNWWRVSVSGGNNGWVAEGRPTDPGGYLIDISGIEFDTECVADFDFEPGEIALVTQNVRVRAAPNLDGRVVTVAPAGSPVRVLSGPECATRSSIKWFQIQVEVLDFVYTGWMSQGANGAIWLIPTDLPSEEAGTLCGPLFVEFQIGTFGYVNSFEGRSRYLRAAPGLNSQVLFILVDGVPFEFIGGPVCANNINYWEVRLLSGNNPVEGWVAEGSRGVGQWLSPVDPGEYER